jgi:hypothetical protein
MRRFAFLLVFFVAFALRPAAIQGANPVQNPPPDPCETFTDIMGGTAKALACEWLDTDAVVDMLDAMNLSIHNMPQAGVGKVWAHANDAKREVYGAALILMQNQPSDHVEAAFLQLLATANSRNTQKMNDVDRANLFNRAEAIIKAIFDHDGGKRALVRVNLLFGQERPYQAVFELLSAAWHFAGPPSNPPPSSASDLETLRACYEKDPNKLFSLVSEKMSSSK